MMIFNDAWGVETAGWAMDDSDEVLTLVPADLEAALEFSDFTSETGPLDLDELRGFAVKALPDDVKPSEIVCGAFRGFYGEYVDDEAFWRQWWLSTGERHLFVTYHSDPEERDAHAAVVDWMLGSLSLAEEAGAEDEK